MTLKLKVKLAAVGALIAVTVLSVNFLIGADKVTISSKGKAKATVENGVAHFECDNSDNITCTITIEPIN